LDFVGESAPRSRRSTRRSAFLPKVVPDALSGFTVKLKSPILIPKKRFTYLTEFKDNVPETFVRGTGLDLRLGRYTIPYTAVYNFHININIQRPLKAVKGTDSNEGVTARLCIDAQCFNNIMKFRTESSSNAKLLTLNFSGHLSLQKNQYVEVVVENALPVRIVVTNCIFTGYLVGL